MTMLMLTALNSHAYYNEAGVILLQ
uniref:Uncharacterized protein n=1 Tax=Rhizophora mucronata TaxID=61149 RepID=A0A2P2NF49_RHIMU